jgi:hypothetical protein
MKVKNKTIIIANLQKTCTQGHSGIIYLPPPLYKIYEPTTKFSAHKYSGVKALQKSKIVRTHLLQTTTHLIIKLQGFEASPYLPKS